MLLPTEGQGQEGRDAASLRSPTQSQGQEVAMRRRSGRRRRASGAGRTAAGAELASRGWWTAEIAGAGSSAGAEVGELPVAEPVIKVTAETAGV